METKLSLKTVTEIATAMEQAEKGPSDIQGHANGEGKVNIGDQKKT